MAQFADRKAVSAWLNAHDGQRVRLTCPGSTLRVVGTTDGIEELDACSTDIYHGELRTGVPGLQIAVTLHDQGLALHLLAESPEGGKAPVSLPVSIPYDRVRLDPADAPDHSPEEPEFSPYELLHFPRSY
ncbi:MAG TPA: hypothetical protein VKB51_19300 [bacterium]|nr:hypothetical protein [bacterium]